MNNKMDWEVLQKVADYQVLKGGDVGKDFRTLLDSKTATFYDDRGAKLSEERLMPLLRHYLRDGIDGRTDRKNVESLLTYMGQLTTASPSSIDFSGDKDLKKYVEVGGDFKTGSSYDSKWFTDSIDATVGAVETNLSYLESVKMGLSPAQRMDCDTMIERYTSMRDRVRKLEDTCPESQKTVVDNMKELIRRVQSNRTNIETGAYHLDVIGTTSDNIFKVTDDLIKKSETVVTNPPKGAKKLSDSECGFNIIRKEKDSSFIRNIVVKEYRESIRAMINAIEDDFAQQKADLVTMQTQKKELLQTKSLVAANFDELEKQLNNGQIEQWEFNDAEFELSQKYEMAEQELNTITQDYQNESMRYSNLSLTWKTLKFKIEQLLSESKTAVLT